MEQDSTRVMETYLAASKNTLADRVGITILEASADRVTVGIEINATHHRAATTGGVTGVATLLHGGRTVTTYEIVISDDAGRRVCTSRLTCLLIDRVPGQAAGGTPTPGDPRPLDQG